MKTYTLFILFVLANFSYITSQTKPSIENTGTKGTLSEYSGSTTIKEDGTILENFIIDGTLNIQANDVIVRNCLITSGGIYGIRANHGYTGLIVEDCEIRNMRSAAILGDDFIAKRCNIWNSGADGIKPGRNFLIEGCYFHKLGYIDDAHADGIQMVAGGNGIIRGNTFDMPYNVPGYKNSQCIIMLTNNGVIDNVLIENNWIDGGGFSVQVRDKGNGHGIPKNVSVVNNFFGRNHQFATHIVDDGVIVSCNRWEDTNEIIGECKTLSVNNETVNSNFSIYPNPASEKMTLHTPKEIGLLNIYNISGKKVYSSTTDENTTLILKTDTFANGIYIVDFRSKNVYKRSKVVVNHSK